jgi:fatty-acyl-CoA synthase
VNRATSFVAVLERHAEQTPNTVALRDPSGSLTYAELWDAMRSIAGWLRATGADTGDRIAIALPGSVANLVAMFAAMACGAVAAPLNTSLRPRELVDYLERIDASLVLTSPALRAELADQTTGRVLELGDPLTGGDPLAPFAGLDLSAPSGNVVAVDPPAPAIMFGTGGTTGVPKAAMWSHEALWLYGASCTAAMEVRRTDVELFFSPQFHIALVTGPFGTLFSGGAVHVLPAFDTESVIELLAAGEITRLFGAPTALARVIAHPNFDPVAMSQVRRVLFGSTRSEPGLPDRLAKAFPNAEFITGYGATEFGAVLRLRSWELVDGADHGVGRAVPGVSVLIVGPDEEILPRGEVGELVIRAPWQMLRYWGAGPEVDQAFVHGGVRSGDLGLRDSDGHIHLRGRLKDVVITGGENVFPVEVEDVLSSHPAVAEAAVVGVLDTEWGERVEAAVVLTVAASAPSPAGLNEYCRERLAGYKVPKRFHVLDQLPLTSAMKVDKRVLREQMTSA